MNVQRFRWNGIVMLTIFLAVLVFGGTPAFANGSETIVQAGTGLGGAFDTQLTQLTSGILGAMHVILIVMTAIAGMMIVFGIEDGKKFIWQAMLGIGLAANFGAFLLGVGTWDIANQGAPLAQVEYFQPEIVSTDQEGGASSVQILGDFLQHYETHIIDPGAENILSYCLRLLVILTVVQATWELSTKIISGDKLQYLLHMTLKMGFYMFLMMNWITFMGALGEGFQLLGSKAGGSSAAVELGDVVNKIVQFAFDMVLAFYEDIDFDSLGVLLIAIIGIVILTYCLFMTALELFITKIEFLTMALITIPLLSFGVTTKFSFLTEKAIGAMFNLAIKLSCVAFIASMAVPFVESFVTKLKQTEGAGEDIGLILQAILACGIIFLLTKKVPALVSGLLNGAPQLGSSGMVDMAKSAGNRAVGAVSAATGTYGAVQAARTAAAAAGSGGVKGTLMQLGKQGIMRSGPVQGYRDALHKFNRTQKYTGTKTLKEIASYATKEGKIEATQKNSDKSGDKK